MMSLPCRWCSRGHGLLSAWLREFSPCSCNFVEGAGLGKRENPGGRWKSKAVLPDDQVQRLAGGGAAGGDGPAGPAFEALGVETALAGDNCVGGGEAGVEVDGVEDEVGAGAEVGAVGPEAAGEPAGAAAHRHAARVAGELGGEGGQPLAQPLDRGRVRALLGGEDTGG